MKYIVVIKGEYTVYDYLTTASKGVGVDKRTIRNAIDNYGTWMGRGVMIIPAKHIKG
jgi:hypothetical protein